MKRQTDKQLRQYLAVSAAMTRLEAVVAGLCLRQVLTTSCILSVVSAATLHHTGICTISLFHKTAVTMFELLRFGLVGVEQTAGPPTNSLNMRPFYSSSFGLATGPSSFLTI